GKFLTRSIPHILHPLEPVPTKAILNLATSENGTLFVPAFISESGFKKVVPAIIPVVAKKCRLDI
ncbi:MAG: hypothetical protein LBS09_09805, partial [Bacteroidales bacterium]|nr:hypothetical protein [Bacteroidales bacterium]